VTIARDTLSEADAVFAALAQLRQQIVFCYPNADAGSHAIIERVKSFCHQHRNARLFVNLNPLKYWSLLACANLFIGNSSSGIMETPSLTLPSVNIGMRQRGRERARNVLEAEPTIESILESVRRGLDPAFRNSLSGMVNPYGEGKASERIADILSQVPLGEKLLIKHAVPLEGTVWHHGESSGGV
jgi:UDP-N-acetylglucosamine 2-epimerase (non-hydrolysing)/GDP/UDP-N,N'-diacetylbacillosamine 2-epimerase (hydrolysing)